MQRALQLRLAHLGQQREAGGDEALHVARAAAKEPAVARDAAVRKVNPWLKPEIANVARVTRPTVLGTKYAQGSQIIYQGLNQILNGQDAKNVLPGIEQRLNRLLR